MGVGERTLEFDAGVLHDADAGAHEAQRAAGARVAARDELALADVVEVDDRKVDDRREVRELLQHLHARRGGRAGPHRAPRTRARGRCGECSGQERFHRISHAWAASTPISDDPFNTGR